MGKSLFSLKKIVPGKEGFVLIAQPTENKTGNSGIQQKTDSFAKTGEIDKMFNPRLIHAFRQGDTTFYMQVVPGEKFNFYNYAKENKNGDLPGVDFKDVPRPPASKRELSVIVLDDGIAMSNYSTNRSLQSVEEFYRREMPNNAWTEDRNLSKAQKKMDTRNGKVLSFKKEIFECNITLTRENGKTGVAVIFWGK